MTIRRFNIAVTTDASGDATVYSPFMSGYIQDIEYVKTDFADGVDFTITAEASGRTIWTESNVNAAVVKAPRQPVYSTAGVAALFAAGGTAVLDRIALGRDRVKFVVASGGNAKTGEFIVTVDDGR
jgi:hypothetical protein